VLVESDDRVCNALEQNRNKNNCEFIIKPIITNKKFLDLSHNNRITKIFVKYISEIF
jgi:hypothetical protein